MPGKHFDLDRDPELGGNGTSDVYVASQKAVKSYVDGQINGLATVASSGSYEDLTDKPDDTSVVFRQWS